MGRLIGRRQWTGEEEQRSTERQEETGEEKKRREGQDEWRRG